MVKCWPSDECASVVCGQFELQDAVKHGKPTIATKGIISGL